MQILFENNHIPSQGRYKDVFLQDGTKQAVYVYDCDGSWLLIDVQGVDLIGGQQLTFDGQNLGITGGNEVDLSTLVPPEQQSLTLVGSQLSISGGNTVDFGPLVNPANQTLSVAGTNLTISNGNTIALGKQNVGLNNVDNTSDLLKPISTATQTALNGKANTSHTHNVADINATGTPSNTTFLRGDGSWATPAAPTLTFTGDVTGSGTSSIALTLANSGVTPGSYSNPSITVDAKGRVTAASSGVTPDSVFFNDVHFGQKNLTSSGLAELSGAIDGVNKVFVVPESVYQPGTIQVYLNGVLQVPGEAIDESDASIGEFEFVTAPVSGDQVYVIYTKYESSSDTVMTGLIAGSNISVTDNGDGTWTIDATGGGAVTSVFGRTGAVVAADNDYEDLQIFVDDTDIQAATGGTVLGDNVHEIFLSLISSFGTAVSGLSATVNTKADKAITINGYDLSANRTLTQDDIGDGSTYKRYSATEKTKLAGIATGATANDTDANLKNRANHTGTQTASTISDFSTAADARISAAAGTSIASLVGGVIPTSQIPAIALVTVQTAASQVAMLALTTQEGDMVVRTDEHKTYVRNAGTSGTMTDFTLLDTPTDLVTSVNGQVGTVVLGKSDVGLSNVTNTSDANKPVSTAQQTALDLKANLASPTFTGTVSGITKAMVGLGNVDNTSDATKNSATATLTNKRITQRVQTLADAATVTPDFDGYDRGKVTELSQATAIANPSGTPTAMQSYILRIKSTSARALTWGTQYRAVGTALPSTTIAGKYLYIGLIWNADDSKVDVIAQAQEA